MLQVFPCIVRGCFFLLVSLPLTWRLAFGNPKEMGRTGTANTLRRFFLDSGETVLCAECHAPCDALPCPAHTLSPFPAPLSSGMQTHALQVPPAASEVTCVFHSGSWKRFVSWCLDVRCCVSVMCLVVSLCFVLPVLCQRRKSLFLIFINIECITCFRDTSL